MTDFSMQAGSESVSRETIDLLEQFAELVRKWNPVINLVSKPSLSVLWDRHIRDSLQLHELLPDKADVCLDIGSGGGFPGIVLAILSQTSHPARCYTLVESDQRKAAFLREAARSLNLTLVVLPERIETIAPHNADVISARAVAPLSKLLEWTCLHLDPQGTCLFPKGSSYPQEIADARRFFEFECEAIPSVTDRTAAVLRIQKVNHA